MGQSDISFASAACNLGVIFDSELALKEQVNKLCQLAYLETRRIGSVRQCLSVEATRTLVSSLVLSRLIIAMLSLLALLRFSLIKSGECSTAQLASSTKLQNLLTLLLYSLISTGCRSAAGLDTK